MNRPMWHVAGIVHANGSQWCERCGHLLRAPGAPLEPQKRGTLVARSEPCRLERAPRFKPTPATVA